MLKVTNLRKEYDRVVAVDGVSLEVRRGQMFGLLGPNGAGKTTTIRTVLNIIKPDSGEITFDGQPFSESTWDLIGYLPEERGLYRKSKIIHAILYFASLKNIPEPEARRRAAYWLERFELKDAGNRRVEELSKGNQQKVQLICSLLHRPPLLILDEPFSGLDPVNQILLKDILQELRKENTAIVFSTHQMEQVEKMCDEICLINKGKQVLAGELSDVKRRYGTNTIRLEFEGDGSFLRSLSNVKRADVYQNYAEIELEDVNRSGDLIAKLDGKVRLKKFEIMEPSLNSIFVSVVGGVPQSDQQPMLAAAEPEKVPMDPRLKRQMLSSVFGFVATMGLLIFELTKPEPQIAGPGILFAATIFSVFKYLQVKAQVDKERREKQGGRS